MSLKSRAEKVTSAVVDLIDAETDPATAEAIAKIVEKALIDSYRDCTERNTRVAATCCAEDEDKAHKIAEEMRNANTALIANLSALR
jgi:hypothetical protein